MPQISVLTCTHNPRADYLEQVLTALRHQSLDEEQWEFLLIDNYSEEPLADRVDLSWHPHARHIREEQLGLTHARLRGIRESTGDLIVFVDDDNVLDPDFLERALATYQEWPILGAWAGQTRPGFEAPPPEWTRRYWSRLVIREFNDDRWSNLRTADEAMPSGAGMCVRRSVADFYLSLHDEGHRTVVMDRLGSSLLSGGDTDLAMCACDMNLGVGLFSSLKLTHLIPKDRLTEDYLAKLLESLAYSALVLESFRSANLPAPRGRTTALADTVRLLFRSRRERRFFRAIRRGEDQARRFLADKGRAARNSEAVVAKEQTA